jgi:hypothetical protein
MVSVPPNSLALLLSVQDVRNAIAVIAMAKIFFMVLCDRIYGQANRPFDGKKCVQYFP